MSQVITLVGCQYISVVNLDGRTLNCYRHKLEADSHETMVTLTSGLFHNDSSLTCVQDEDWSREHRC